MNQLLDQAVKKSIEHSGMTRYQSIADAARTVRRIFKKPSIYSYGSGAGSETDMRRGRASNTLPYLQTYPRIATSQLKMKDVQAAWTAFRMYQKGKADFADCLLGATNRIGGCDSTVTFDQPASKLEGFQLL